MCEEVHPAGLTSSIRIAASAVKDYLVAYTVHRQVKVDTLKCARQAWVLWMAFLQGYGSGSIVVY